MNSLSDGVTRWWMGIDVGGTFTDVVAVNLDTGEFRDHKVLTTSDTQESGVLAALADIAIPIETIEEIVHGHTVGINAILSRQGAATGLLATAGHRDLLDIGRMDREFGPRFYDPTWLRPHQERPIIRRRHRVGVLERTGWDGAETVALDEDAIRKAAHRFRDEGLESVAICFLNSYLSDRHEQRAAELVREECPDLYVQTSSLYPVIKEHERTTTVALDAYVGPIVTGYLGRLEKALAGAGFTGSLRIMTMNGGVGSVAETGKAPVFQLVSGPVGGVSGAVHVARTAGPENLLTMDVGGTSTDISAIRQAQTPSTDLWAVEHGLTMTMPVVDVLSVGSGAGSIVHADHLGTLRVGPGSAGSDPGPACYDRGGERPTLTDACVELGILQPDLFAGGALRLDPTKAHHALEPLASEFGMSVMELADGAYRLACSDIAGSIRSRSTYRGLDLREFSLLAFGAAGPMLASQVAHDLGVTAIIVPNSPGQFSAYGLLVSDLRVSKARSPMTVLGSYGSANIEADYRILERAVASDLARQGVDDDRIVFERVFSAMYAGQTWDNQLSLASGEITDDRVAAMHQQVHEFYRSQYGFSAEELPIMITTLQVTGVSRRPATPSPPTPSPSGDPIIRHAPVRLGGVSYEDIPIYARGRIKTEDVLVGPALIVEPYATTVIESDSSALVDRAGYIHITIGQEGTI